MVLYPEFSAKEVDGKEGNARSIMEIRETLCITQGMAVKKVWKVIDIPHVILYHDV